MEVSASKSKLWAQCISQYHYRYRVKGGERGVQEESPNMAAGTVVHRVLELAARKRIGQQEKAPVAKKELLDLLEVALKEPQRETWKENLMCTPEVASLARDTIDACWKKISFVHTIEAEKSYKANLGPIGGVSGEDIKEDLVVNMIIDRIDELPDGSIKIVDYKAGFGVMSSVEAELDEQINLYLAAGAKLFPGRKISIEFHYLTRGILLGPIPWTKDREEWVTAYIKAVAYRIAKWKTPKETPNTYCSSCFRQGDCSAYKRLLKGSLLPLAKTLGENLAEYVRLSDIEKNAESQKKILKQVINDACDTAEDGEVYESAGESAYRGRLIFTPKTEYKDLKKTALAVTKIVHEADVASRAPQVPKPIPTDYETLKAAYEAELKRSAKIEEDAKKLQIAFGIACSIAKAQTGLVDTWVDSLPKDIGMKAANALDTTATAAGYYKVDVEMLPNPFVTAEPEPRSIETAAA